MDGTTLEYVEVESLAKIDMMLESGNRPPAVICTGPPGTGKTHMFKNLAKKRPEIKWTKVIQLPLYPPEELRGFVTLRADPRYGGKNVSESSVPSDIIPPPNSGPGVIVLDDFNIAVPAQQALVYRLIHEGVLGPHELPNQTFIALTGNGGGDKAVANRIPSTIINRTQYFRDVVPDSGHWLAWAGGSGTVHPMITAFIHNLPHKLFEAPHEDRAWCSPRSLELMSRDLSWRAERIGLKEAFKAERMATYIGEPTANELYVFTKYEHIFSLVKKIEAGHLQANDKELNNLSEDEKYVLCIATAQSPKMETAKKYKWFLGATGWEQKDVACFGVIYTARSASDGEKAAVPFAMDFLKVFGTELASNLHKFKLTAQGNTSGGGRKK